MGAWYVVTVDVQSQWEGRNAERGRSSAVQTVPHRTVFQLHFGPVRRHRTAVSRSTSTREWRRWWCL